MQVIDLFFRDPGTPWWDTSVADYTTIWFWVGLLVVGCVLALIQVWWQGRHQRRENKELEDALRAIRPRRKK